jgi:hypothetical protein
MRPGSVGQDSRARPRLRQLTDTSRQSDNETHDDMRTSHSNDEKTEARVRRFPDAESFVQAAAYHDGAVGRRGHREDSLLVP